MAASGKMVRDCNHTRHYAYGLPAQIHLLVQSAYPIPHVGMRSRDGCVRRGVDQLAADCALGTLTVQGEA